MIVNNKIGTSLAENVSEIQKKFDNINDLKFREFEIGLEGQLGVIVFIEGLVDGNQLHLHVLKPLEERHVTKEFRTIKDIEMHFIGVAQLAVVEDLSTLCDKLMDGNAVVLLNGRKDALAVEVRNIIGRSVGEPSIENVVYGPHESFVENLKINTILVRKRIKSTDLQIEAIQVGTYTKSYVQMMYIKGLHNEQLVEQVRQRLQGINVDAIYDIQNVYDILNQNHKYTIMSLFHKTERPDTVASLLVEGRVVVMVDGSPNAIAAPALFLEFFQSAEDRYSNYFISNVIRLLRFIAFILAMLSPGLFIAMVSYHQDMIPLTLLISLSKQSGAVPFPIIFQLIVFELTFEIIREASTRLPKSIGSAVSLVGALVIGSTAVEAGLVMPSIIIVVAITALCSFVFQVYAFSFSIRILRFGFILIGYVFGLFGIMYGIVALILYLSSVEVFGIPYLTGISPFKGKKLEQLFVEMPTEKVEKQATVFQKIIKRGQRK